MPSQQTRSPKLGIAYVLLIGLRWFGLHRRYLGYTQSASVFLWVTGLSIPLLFVGGIGLYGFYGIFFAMLVDFFLLPGLNKRAFANQAGEG